MEASYLTLFSLSALMRAGGAVTKLSGNGKITREIKNRTLILFFDILCLLRGIVIFKWRLSIYTL